MKILYWIIGLGVLGVAVIVYFFMKTNSTPTVLNPTGNKPNSSVRPINPKTGQPYTEDEWNKIQLNTDRG